ncbi:MAG: T9SS type A sorting domain-containing protein, partial [bacterium]
NPTTNIRFTLLTSGFTSLSVYDILGRKVATLVNEEMKSGSYLATFDASRFASGIYYYRIQTGSFAQTKKMVLLK